MHREQERSKENQCKSVSISCWINLTLNQSKFEFLLRFQQYIELVRTQNQQKLLEAISHAKKYLLPLRELYPVEVQQAGGLLAFPPGSTPPTYGVRVHDMSLSTS